MSVKVGIDQFFKNSTSVGGARSTTGIVTGGALYESSEVRDLRSVGNFKPQDQREALVMAYGNVGLELQNKNFLDLAERNASGKLTEFDVEGGNDGESQIHSKCKMDTVTIEAAAGAELRGTFAWKAKKGTSSGGGTNSPSSDATLMWFEGSLSGIAGVELVGATISVNHNVDWIPVIKTSEDPKRAATYIVEKNQVIMANLRFLEQENVNLMATELALINSVVLTFVGDQTVTITLSNLKRGTHDRPFTPMDVVSMGAVYSVEDWAIS